MIEIVLLFLQPSHLSQSCSGLLKSIVKLAKSEQKGQIAYLLFCVFSLLLWLLSIFLITLVILVELSKIFRETGTTFLFWISFNAS